MSCGNRSIVDFYSPRLRRRQFLKASLIGVSGLATAIVGITRLETLIAAAPGVGRWRHLIPRTAPSPRFNDVMAFDGARGLPILVRGGSRKERWASTRFNWICDRPAPRP